MRDSSVVRRLWRAFGWVAASVLLLSFLAGSLAVSAAPASASGPTALVFGPTVTGGSSSQEATDLVAAGYTVTVATAAQWDAMT